jgi:signal transduction histidine kinase
MRAILRGAGTDLIQLILVVVGLIGVAYLDHRSGAVLPVSHLYYLPILLAAISFGYLGGLAAAGLAVTFYLLVHVALTGQLAHLGEADLLKVLMFLAVAFVAARLREDRYRLDQLTTNLRERNDELEQLNDRLRELSAARADFVAIASHELRTPLTTILGSAEVLLQLAPADASRSRRLTAHIIAAAGQLQRTVESLLNAALIESGRFTLRCEAVGIRDLVDSCGQTFASIAAGRLLLPDVPSDLVVQGDRDKLAQVLSNLIGNALKYSPEGSPVTLSVDCELEVIRLVVSDQGYGVAADDLPHIFERYYRADTSRVRATRGAGLGLSISRDVVRAHGGDLTAWSAPGQGSRFTVSIPRAMPDHLLGESSGYPPDAARNSGDAVTGGQAKVAVP